MSETPRLHPKSELQVRGWVTSGRLRHVLVACLARRLVRLRAGFRPPGSPVLRAASSALKRAGVALELLDNLGIIHTPKG